MFLLVALAAIVFLGAIILAFVGTFIWLAVSAGPMAVLVILAAFYLAAGSK